MKRAAIVLISALILVIPAAAWAAQQEQISQDDPSVLQDFESAGEKSFLGEDFSLTASLKVWHLTHSFKTNAQDEIDISSNMFGPAINLTYKSKYYTGLSFYRGSGFDYNVNTTSVEGTKSDFDIWAGYSFHYRCSVFLGYKSSLYEQDADAVTAVAEGETTLSGPVIGVAGNYPIKESGFILFGTFGYAFLSADIKLETQEYVNNILERERYKTTVDYSGPAIEFGISYIFKNIPKLSLTGGYKYQYYEDEDNSDIYESFYGFTFGANYRF